MISSGRWAVQNIIDSVRYMGVLIIIWPPSTIVEKIEVITSFAEFDGHRGLYAELHVSLGGKPAIEDCVGPRPGSPLQTASAFSIRLPTTLQMHAHHHWVSYWIIPPTPSPPSCGNTGGSS